MIGVHHAAPCDGACGEGSLRQVPLLRFADSSYEKSLLKESGIFLECLTVFVCSNRGEYFLSEEVSQKMIHLAHAAVAAGAKVEILMYAA
jgi:hypothetical protein